MSDSLEYNEALCVQANLIKIEIHISDVLVIDDRDFSITFSLYFNVQWRDPRIRVNANFFQDR